MELVAFQAETAGVKIEIVPADEPVAVVGDPDELARVVDNIVGNAVKYTPDAGTLTALATKIRNGGSGVWGEEVMPAHPLLTMLARQQRATAGSACAQSPRARRSPWRPPATRASPGARPG